MRTLDHFAFQVGNMDAAIQFYVEKLEFTLKSRWTTQSEGQECAFLVLDDLNLELLQDLKQADYHKPDLRPPYCPHLALETQDMAKTVAQLEQKGVKIIHGPLAAAGRETWLYFADPDNNVLEYIQWFRHG